MPGQFSSGEPPPALAGAPCWTGGPVQPFHFRSRTEPVDWRRLAALDVDRIAREMDVGVLQQFVSAVTFCDVGAERCPHCRGAVDPALQKLLRVSQLCTEYLLHCQDYLSAQVAALEDRLQGALSQAERSVKEREQMDAELQAVKQESRRKKKLIATQQLLLQASANNYHKCLFCEKSFVNYSYLQGHLQRRHPEITDAERQKKRQVEQMEEGMEQLKEKLRLSQSRLETEREADTLRRQQELEEQRRREESERQEMERWKEGERRKLELELSELKQLLLQEFRDVASQNSSIQAKLLDLQSKEVVVSHLDKLQDDEEKQRRERELMERMAQKKSEWRKRLKETQNRHQQEREELLTENKRLQRALSDENPAVQTLQRQISSLTSQIRQRDKRIRTHEEQIKKLSARPITVPVVQNIPSSPDEEEEEDEDEDEGLEDSLEGQQNLLEALRGDPNLAREFRPDLEQTLDEKLEKMGLRKGTTGISRQTFQSLSALVLGHRQQRLRRQPDLSELRQSLERELDRRVKRMQRNQTNQRTSEPSLNKQRGRMQAGDAQRRLRTNQSSPKPSLPGAKSQMAPQPTPRTRTHTHSQPAKAKKKSTPPFSSEEDSVEDSAYITSSKGKPSPSIRIIKSGKAPVDKSGEYWSDSDLSEGAPTPRPHQGHGTHGSVVQSLTRSLERQLSSPMTKPVGGVKVLPPATTASPRPTTIVKQLALTDEDSDLELSSVEEITPLPAGVRGSSEVGGTTGTSVWSSSASRQDGW